jgi:hypothetical protein
MALPVPHYPYREDWISAGFFVYLNNGVYYADNGVSGLRQFVGFDQGDFKKEDVSGSSFYQKIYDPTTSRLYDRVSPQVLSSGAQEAHLIRRFRLPRDFGRSAPWTPLMSPPDPYIGLFPPGALSFFSYRSGSVTSMKVTLLKAGTPDATINGLSCSPAGAASWQFFSMTPGSVYNPGDFLTLLFDVVAPATGMDIRFADYLLSYLTQRGNV